MADSSFRLIKIRVLGDGVVRACFPPFNGPLNLLVNRRISSLLSHNNTPVFVPISLAEKTWLRIQEPLKEKVAVDNRTQEEGTSAARGGNVEGGETQAAGEFRPPTVRRRLPPLPPLPPPPLPPPWCRCRNTKSVGRSANGWPS